MQPKDAAAADAGPESGELTLESYAEQLKRARQMSSLASLLPKGAMAAAGGSEASVAQTLKRQEDIVRCVRRAVLLRAQLRCVPLASGCLRLLRRMSAPCCARAAL